MTSSEGLAASLRVDDIYRVTPWMRWAAAFCTMAVAVVATGATRHGTQIRVGMRGQRFTVTRVVAMTGDSVRFDLESGGPHNIAFYSDSIPAGALSPLARNLGSAPTPLLMSTMLLDPGDSLVLSLAGLPPGSYPFFCAPHLGGGMVGQLVVTARDSSGVSRATLSRP
jgi:plastocyanin